MLSSASNTEELHSKNVTFTQHCMQVDYILVVPIMVSWVQKIQFL